MGNKKNKHIIIVIALLSLASFGVYYSPGKAVTSKTISLQLFLQNIPDYTFLKHEPLEKNITSMLDLDDYGNINYRKDGHLIGLYIGYYYSIRKIAAVHDPLVCFPGGGWQVDAPKPTRFLYGEHKINYNQFVARNERHRLLVMYWYQAHELTTTNVYKNRFNAIRNMINTKNQEHALVRLTVPLADLTQKEAIQVGEDFIEQFYPVFLDYINNQPKQSGAQ